MKDFSVLSALLIPTEDMDSAVEMSLFRKNENYSVTELEGKPLFSLIRVSNVTMPFPNKQWPTTFLNNWNHATSKFNEVGIRVINDYLKNLQAYTRFTKEHNEEDLKYTEINDQKGHERLYDQSNKFRQVMVRYRKNDDRIFEGKIEPLRSTVRNALNSILPTFQQEYEDLAHQVAKILQELINQRKSPKLGLLKNRKPLESGHDAGLIYDAFVYYSDLLSLIEDQHKS